MNIADPSTTTSAVVIRRGETTVTPVYVGEVMVDAIGSSTRVTDDCGDTETRDTSATGWQLTIDGLLTHEQWRTLRQMDLKGNTATFNTDPISGSFVVEDVSITQTDETNKWDGPNSEFSGQLVYSFQIKTKDNEGTNGVV